MTLQLKGLLAAPHTPMHADGNLYPEMIERQAEMLSDAGLIGAFVCGTTGEGLSLTLSERFQVAERWRSAAPKGFRVIVNVSHLSLGDARALAAHAQRTGADAIASMSPCFFKPDSPEQLVAFCAEAAAAAPQLPFFYYHLPSMTAVNIPVADFLRAGEKQIPTLSGVKFTAADLGDLGRCLTVDPERFTILCGRDDMLLAALALGVTGGIGTSYNFAAPLYQRIMRNYEAGDMVSARADQAKAAEMSAILQKYGGLPATKAVMRMIGLDCGPSRLPQHNLSDRVREQLRTELEGIGFFDDSLRA